MKDAKMTSLCVEDVILSSNTDESVITPVSDIPINLISCAVDDDKPVFYITGHESTTKFVYIVKPRDIVKSKGLQDYVLFKSVARITVLNDINIADLFDDYIKGENGLPEARRFLSLTDSNQRFLPQYTDGGQMYSWFCNCDVISINLCEL